MARIQSSVGLITGIPITDTVDQLLQISAQPRDLLVTRNEGLQAERVAITELTALVIGVQFSAQNLGSRELFNEKVISSTDDDLLSVASTGTPAAGTFEFTPFRQAQNHQLLSGGFTGEDALLGEGEVSIGFGGFVDGGLLLDELNSGNGVQRGQIRITDRSGTSSIIDLRFSETIDDIVDTINQTTEIDVSASVRGDRLQLVDNTGQAVSNLRVREVGSGTTAADLGLAGINIAADRVEGDDIVSLHADLQLNSLNDGNGVFLRSGVADLEVTFSDGSAPLRIEFRAQTKGPTEASVTTEAANGPDAQFTLTSTGTGAAWDGYNIVFEDDEEITSGGETVEVDTIRRAIRFQIDAGSTRAVHLVEALNKDETASQLFVGSLLEQGDGTGVVDLQDSGTTSGGGIEFADERTLGDVLETINAADPARLRAEINATGDGIDLIDLTAGEATTPSTGGPNLWTPGQPIRGGSAGTGPNLWIPGQPIANPPSGFSVRSLYAGSVAEDLGLVAPSVDGVISSRRRLGGLSTVLLDSLAGGNGLGQLGSIRLTDRSGNSAVVDLSSAETLEQVIDGINAADVSITASVNAARNGIEISDSSAGSGNLVIANGDITNTADVLQLATDTTQSSINSGSLSLQHFHEQLSLESLNHGRGVGRGSFLITDSQGRSDAVNIRVQGAESVGDVIGLINGLDIGVRARINETGDGLLLIDTAAGAGSLTVTDVGNGTTASDLNIEGASTTKDVFGVSSQVIDGATTLRIQLDAEDTLSDLVQKINEAEFDVAASVVNSGSGPKPARLSLVSQHSGAAGAILVDGGQIDLSLQELVSAKDALVVLGSSDSPIATAIATSSTNDFETLIDGVTVSVNGTSQDSVTISIEQTQEPIATQLGAFTEQYNRLREKLDELTFFDEVENTTGVLFGRSETLRIEFDLANLVTGRFFGAGPIQSLEEIGIGLDGTGKMGFDAEKFSSKYAEDRDAVERFFTQEQFGVAAKLESVAEQLAGVENSVLINRTQTLQQTMDVNFRRITSLTDALDVERESLLEEFFRLETVLSQLQNSLSAVTQIQALPPLVNLA